MEEQSVAWIDAWWADVFGIDPVTIWSTASARPRAKLEGYPGLFVAWRGNGLHVSTPRGEHGEVADELTRHPVTHLQDPGFWHEFAERSGRTLIGPSTHSYLDVDPGPLAEVDEVDVSALASLQSRVSEDDWREAGFDDAPPHAFAFHDGGLVVAASNLNPFGDQPRDIGVLVAPEARGRGLAAVVGRHAASYAVREYGLARWSARNTNVRSLAASRRLGFQPWCTQLAIR